MRRVALELGGKNPNIIFADTDFDTAVDNALTAAFLHSGQVCSAGARLIVQDGLYETFAAELAARADRIRLGSGLDPQTECGPLISQSTGRRWNATSRWRWPRARAAGRRAAAGVTGAGARVLLAADGVRRVPSRDGGGAG